MALPGGRLERASLTPDTTDAIRRVFAGAACQLVTVARMIRSSWALRSRSGKSYSMTWVQWARPLGPPSLGAPQQFRVDVR